MYNGSMPRRLLPFLTLLCLLQQPALGADRLSVKVISFREEFRVFIASASGAAPEVQIAAWMELERKLPPGMPNLIFGARGDALAAARRDTLPDYVERVSPRLDEVLRMFSAGPPAVRAAEKRFAKLLPDFSPGLTAYFVPSFFRIGGYANAKAGGMLFGPDTIAVLLGDKVSLPVMVAHELAHLYLSSHHNDEAGTMAASLWSEGGATYISSLAYPEASMTDLLMNQEPGEPCADPKYAGTLAGEALPLLSSPADSPRIDPAWFDKQPRRGVCLGLRAFAMLAQKHPVTEMAAWGPERYSTELASALKKLAKAAPAASK